MAVQAGTALEALMRRIVGKLEEQWARERVGTRIVVYGVRTQKDAIKELDKGRAHAVVGDCHLNLAEIRVDGKVIADYSMTRLQEFLAIAPIVDGFERSSFVQEYGVAMAREQDDLETSLEAALAGLKDDLGLVELRSNADLNNLSCPDPPRGGRRDCGFTRSRRKRAASDSRSD